MTTHPTCRWCGKAPHGGEWCPLVKAIEYHDVADRERRVSRVEFHSPQPINWNKQVHIGPSGQWENKP